MFVFLSVYVMLNILLSMFVTLWHAVASLFLTSLTGWRGPTFTRRSSLLEVCMSCRYLKKDSKVIVEDFAVHVTQLCFV